MLMTIILAIVIIGLIMAGMAIGVMLQNKPIKGTCGGLNALGMDTECEICGGDQAKCDTENSQTRSKADELNSLTYDATKPKNC